MVGENWHTRALTSLMTLAGFVIMTVSGLVELIRPAGRISYWTHWSFLGLEKAAWDNIHIIGSILFIMGGAFHIYFNWKPIVNYFSAKASKALKHKKELLITGLVSLWVVASGIWSLPPLMYIVDLSEQIKTVWVTSAEHEPPFGHAELLSLQVFCQRMGIPPKEATALLRKKGIKIDSGKQSLEEIAKKNGVIPMEIYAAIKELEPKPPTLEKGRKITADEAEHMFAGSGLGRKPLKDVFKQLSLDPALAAKRLDTIGVKLNPEESVRDIAKRTGKNPIEIIKIMLDAK